MEDLPKPTPLYWIGSSRKDYEGLSESRSSRNGSSSVCGQCGEEEYPSVKVLKGLGGRSVLEILASHDTNAYRAVYTIRFVGAIYVLHAFQKKSKKGIATPQRDIDLIRWRLAEAERLHREGQN